MLPRFIGRDGEPFLLLFVLAIGAEKLQAGSASRAVWRTNQTGTRNQVPVVPRVESKRFVVLTTRIDLPD